MTTAFDDPLAPVGEQFPLGRPDTAPCSWDEPSPLGTELIAYDPYLSSTVTR